MNTSRFFLSAIVAAVAVAATFAMSNVDSVAQGAGNPSEVQDAITRVIPNATAAVVAANGRQPQNKIVAVTLPDTSATEGASVSSQFTAAERGWRLRLATASLTSSNSDLVGFDAMPASADPGPSQNYLRGTIRNDTSQDLAAGMTRLDTVPGDLALAQLDASLRTLSASMPSNTEWSSQVSVIPVGPGPDRFALEATISVTSLPALRDRYGDLLLGLATGLAGAPNATIEGLAVVVTDAGGERLASWRAERAHSGMMLATAGVHLPPTMTTSLNFENRTGGPAVPASAMGALSGKARLGSPIRVRSGGSEIRTHSGEVSTCLPTAGCAGRRDTQESGEPLVLKPSRRLQVFPGYLVRGVRVTLESGRNPNGTRRKLLDHIATHVRGGGWTVRAPKHVTDIKLATIFVQTNAGRASYRLPVTGCVGRP